MYDQNDVDLLLQSIIEVWPVDKTKVAGILTEIAANDKNRPNARVNALRGLIDASRSNVDAMRVIVAAQAIRELGKEKARDQFHAEPRAVAADLARLLADASQGECGTAAERTGDQRRFVLAPAVEIDEPDAGRVAG